jgi:hypothetical protein
MSFHAHYGEGYCMSQYIKGDLKNEKLYSYKGTDMGIDVTKNAVQPARDDAMMGISAGFAPQTLGLSVVARMGASFIFDVGTDAVAAAVEGANAVARETTTDADKIVHWFHHIHW